MPFIVSTTRATAAPPCCAISAAPPALPSTSVAVSAALRIVPDSWCIALAVSCREAACCSVRADRSWAPVAISWEAVATAVAPLRTSAMTRDSASRIEAIAPESDRSRRASAAASPP